jgi:hypothetical protein
VSYQHCEAWSYRARLSAQDTYPVMRRILQRSSPITRSRLEICRVFRARMRSEDHIAERSPCGLHVLLTHVARPQLHELRHCTLAARGDLDHCISSRFTRTRDQKTRQFFVRRSHAQGEDVGAKFTSDENHAVTTRCDWLLQHYLACLYMASLRHMPRVLAIHRSMTRNVLSRRRVRS